MRKIVRLTESDLNRIVRKVINEGVIVELSTADYQDVSKNMRPGTQTSATLYFDTDGSIMLRVGNSNLTLFGPPAPASTQPQPTQRREMDDRLH